MQVTSRYSANIPDHADATPLSMVIDTLHAAVTTAEAKPHETVRINDSTGPVKIV